MQNLAHPCWSGALAASRQDYLLASCHCTSTPARLPVDTRRVLGDYERERKGSKMRVGRREREREQQQEEKEEMQ